MNTRVSLKIYLPLSQYFPDFPIGQSHSYSPIKGTHVEPEAHKF